MKIAVKETKHISNQTAKSTKIAEMGDVDIIVDLLRKHYANPRQTIVQEYLCNARDAHRECNQSKAIEVSLPTSKQPILKIRDFGNKMTKERLENNFLNYGSSTKRDSNTQTGGFGIGSKSGWVYTPTFFIRVIKDKIDTLYEASTAKHYRGALSVIFSKPTSEEDGVEIQIPVQTQDIKHFHNAFYRTTFFWTEAVKVVNLMEDELHSEWLKKDYYTKDNFYFLNLTNSFKKFCSEVNIKLNSSYSTGTVVVDGIPYPAPENMDSSVKATYVFPRMNTGELTISISREAIEEIDLNAKVLVKKMNREVIEKEVLEVRALILQSITPKEKLSWNQTFEHFEEIFVKDKDAYPILKHFPYPQYDIISGKFSTPPAHAKTLLLSHDHRIYYWYHLPVLNTYSFYRTLRNSYAHDKASIKIPIQKPKVYVNDGRDSAGMIESLIKYHARHSVIGGVENIIVINNSSDKKVKAFAELMEAPKLSPILDTLRQGVQELKSSISVRTSPAFPPVVVVRNKENCLKKVIRHGSLGKLINSESLLNEYPEYIIGNWDNEKEVKILAQLDRIVRYSDKVRIIFVAQNDLKFFTDKKFLVGEAYKNGKFLKSLTTEMKEVLAVLESKGRNQEGRTLAKVMNSLQITKINLDGDADDWLCYAQDFKGVCKSLGFKSDPKLVKKIKSVIDHSSYKYYEPFLTRSNNGLKKDDREYFLKVFKL